MTFLLTVSEVSEVLSGLGYELTERQIRYLGLQPSQRWPGSNGGRLFDTVDATVLAVFADLLARCREWELPIWSARAAITYREGELRRAITRKAPRLLLVDPARGTAMLAETSNPAAYALDLLALSTRVAKAARAYRNDEPDVWTGAQRIPLRELVTAG
jgi:hypothetical protein